MMTVSRESSAGSAPDSMEAPSGLSPVLTWTERNLFSVSAIGLVAALVWAGLTPFDPSTRAKGSISTASRTQVVQHLEGGVVREILVAQGARVKAGDPIARIDPTVAVSRAGEGKAKLGSLRARAARLEAEASDAPLAFSEELRREAPEATATETAAWKASSDELARQLANLAEQKAALTTELAVAQEQEGLQVRMGDAARKADLLSARGAVARARQQLAVVSGSIEDAKGRRRAESFRLLAETRATLASLAPGMASDADRVDRTTLRASVDGVVKTLKITTVGGVVQPGEIIAEVTPVGSELLVEAHVPTDRIAPVAPGKSAVVRVEAWDFAKYGTLEGTVTEVSSDAIEDSRKDSRYYRVTIKASSDRLPYAYEGEAAPVLVPGLPVDVTIRSGDRSLLSTLIAPVVRGIRVAIGN